MRRDTDDGQLNLCNATQPTTRGLKRPGQRSGRTSTATLLVSFIGLASLPTVACVDKDTTLIVPADGGTGGGGGGRAGSSNTGGNAGTSMAGGAGAGGATAGSGGMSGAAGSGGVGGIPNDAGTDAAVPDGGVPEAGPPEPLTRPEIATALCVKFDEVVGCEPSPDCQAETELEMSFYDGDGSCFDTTNAYFECLSTDDVSSFSCNGLDPNRPTYNIGANNCVDEENAWLDSFNTGTCP